jgi:hypothetical protein
MNDETKNSLSTLLGLGDTMDNLLEDSNGPFDKRQEPVRALALLEEVLANREMFVNILERALVTRLDDGEAVIFDSANMFDGGGMLKVFRHEDHLHVEAVDPPAVADTSNKPYVQSVAALQAQIYSDQYYVELYQDALRSNSLSSEGVERGAYTSGVLSEMLNDFWFSLPDSPVIRTGPFSLLCDLCEGDPEVTS